MLYGGQVASVHPREASGLGNGLDEEVWVPRSHSHYSQPGLPSGGLRGSAAGLQTVAKVQVNNEGRVQGVTLQDGEEVRSRVVLSCASPQVTFLELTPQVRRVRGEI